MRAAGSACSFLDKHTTTMQPTTTQQKPAHAIGSMISRAYFGQLIDGFDQMHPTEEKFLYIAKTEILTALAAAPEVCGIRFMYGQKAGADMRSRVVSLMPCYEKTTGNL